MADDPIVYSSESTPVETCHIKVESLSGGKFKTSVMISDSTRHPDDILEDVMRMFAMAESRASIIMKLQRENSHEASA